jgi:hypothetical protein
MRMNDDTKSVLTMGFTIRVKRDVTKREVIALCRELEELFGPGNEIRPGSRGVLLDWRTWYGETGGGCKTMKMVMHKKWRVESIAWPRDVPENVMELWKEDESMCFREGWYRTQVLACGRAPMWIRPELRLMREVMLRYGWIVCAAENIRGLRQKYPGKNERKATDYRYYEQALS